jgi:hypothetical protein
VAPASFVNFIQFGFHRSRGFASGMEQNSTKTRLVKAYCTSFYGAEIWYLSHSGIESVCTAWLKGIRRIWQIPNTTHSALLPGLCNTMPLIDMFYKRMPNFVYKCLTSESLLVNFIVRHGMTHGQMDSVVGRNILSCCLRYHTNIDNILALEFQPYDIDRHCVASEDNSIVVTLLAELLQCRDGALSSSGDNFNMSDVTTMIDLLCTC